MENDLFKKIFNYALLGLIILTVLAFLFSSKFRFIVVGIAVVVGIFWLATKVKEEKPKTILFIAGSILAIAFLVIAGTSQSLTAGSTVMSISDVDVIDSGSRLIITGVVGGAENLLINFNKDEINSQLDGYKVNDIATMSISMTDPSIDFPAGSDGNDIYGVNSFNIGLLKSCKNNMPPNGVFVIGNTQSWVTKTCYYSYKSGEIRNFNGQKTENTRVTFKIDGDTIGTLSPSTGTNVISSNDGKTRIEYIGSLTNYEQVGTPFQYDILLTDSKYTDLIQDGVSDDLDDAYASLILCGGLLTNPKTCISSYESKVDNLLVSKNNIYKNDINANRIDFTSNGLRVYNDVITTFPEFKITLDAKYVAIEELSGKPQITNCISDKTIDSGDAYNGKLSVKNIGSNTGSFYGSVSCSGSSTINDVAIGERSVNSGSTESFTTQLYGLNDLSGTQSNKCKVTITDRKSGDSDSCNFNLKVNFIEGSVIPTPQECNKDSDCEENSLCVEGICEKQLTCDKFWQEEGVKTTYKTNILGIIKFGKVDEPVCKTADWVWIVSGSLVIVILGGLALVLYFKKGGKK